MKKAKLKILSLLTVATVISSISLNTISALATGNDIAIQSEEKVLSTLNLVVPTINKGDAKLQMPKVSSDMEIEFIGCDYQEIIDSDLTINEPLVDTKVTVDFRVKQGETSLETKGIEVTVPGKYSKNIGANTKPEVIPSLREWVGKDGDFQIADSSRIVLDGNYEAELSKTAEIFKEDYKDILGKDIEIIT
ncbi:hypothetical protein GBZ86_16635, partial [Clostridium tarantellae]